MAKRSSNEGSIGDVLREIISANKLQGGMDAVAAREAWLSVMGSGVRNYTHNVNFRNGTLYVELTSAVLREELSYGKTKIISMLNEELRREVITDLVLR